MFVQLHHGTRQRVWPATFTANPRFSKVSSIGRGNDSRSLVRYMQNAIGELPTVERIAAR